MRKRGHHSQARSSFLDTEFTKPNLIKLVGWRMPWTGRCTPQTEPPISRSGSVLIWKNSAISFAKVQLAFLCPAFKRGSSRLPRRRRVRRPHDSITLNVKKVISPYLHLLLCFTSGTPYRSAKASSGLPMVPINRGRTEAPVVYKQQHRCRRQAQ